MSDNTLGVSKLGFQKMDKLHTGKSLKNAKMKKPYLI